MEKMLVRGVTKDTDVARISIIGVPTVPGIDYKLFGKIAAKDINIDIILQSVGRGDTKDIAFTTTKAHRDEAIAVLKSLELLSGLEINCDESVAKVSVVGAGMESHPGIAAKMFEALFEADINIQMIATSEIKISVLIDVEDGDRAVEAIHTHLFPCSIDLRRSEAIRGAFCWLNSRFISGRYRLVSAQKPSNRQLNSPSP